MSFITIFKEGMWPGGQLKPPGTPRSAEEKLHTRDDANRKLSALIPGRSSIMAATKFPLMWLFKISPPT
jgi:sorting nexin-25